MHAGAEGVDLSCQDPASLSAGRPQWRWVETYAEFHRCEQVDGPYAVEGDQLDNAGLQWVWCVVEGPLDQPRVASNPFETCDLAMSEAERLARLRSNGRDDHTQWLAPPQLSSGIYPHLQRTASA